MNFNAKFFDELTVSELYEILKVRAQIFMIEQQIHYQDLDGADPKSLHCFLTADDGVAAYLRAFYPEDGRTVKIGRVLTCRHGVGTGRVLMQQSLDVIRHKMKPDKIVVDAQKHAVGFYEKFGFRQTGEDFSEEKIIHTPMTLFL